jgi:hypothetical protein
VQDRSCLSGFRLICRRISSDRDGVSVPNSLAPANPGRRKERQRGCCGTVVRMGVLRNNRVGLEPRHAAVRSRRYSCSRPTGRRL